VTVQAAWTSCKGLERLPVRSQTVSSVKLARDSFDSLLALLLKSEANVMKSSRNLDSSEETEVKVQSIGSVLLKNDMSPGCLEGGFSWVNFFESLL